MSFEIVARRPYKPQFRRSIYRIAIAIEFALALTIGVRVGFASSTKARVGVLELDPSKTLVEFKLGGSLHTTHGKFQMRRGTIKADSRSGNAEGMIVIDATSGDSGDSMRDNRMKDDVLETDLYPEITFAPRHIYGHLEGGGGFNAKIEGSLKLHGVEHLIMIDAQGTFSDDTIIATAHFSVPYVQWGLKDPSVLFLTVAKEVEIDIATAGRITWVTDSKSQIETPRKGL